MAEPDLSLLKRCQFMREIREPIYKYVKLTRVESDIVDSPYFQRLAHISQMHSAHLVYPGAQYSRKLHSLGVMHLTHRMTLRLLVQQYPDATKKLGNPIAMIDNPLIRDKEEWKVDGLAYLYEGLLKQGVDETVVPEENVPTYLIQAMRLAGLLHDLGHGPFSHLVEAVTQDPKDPEKGFKHEAKTYEIVTKNLPTKHPELGGPYLSETDAKVIGAILRGGKHLDDRLAFLHEIISSALDADKLDYLVRDSYFAGTPEYGTVDLNRIIDGMMVFEKRLCFASEAIDSVINAMNAMFFMYNNVYLHKTVRAFDQYVSENLSAVGDEILTLLQSEDFIKQDDAAFLAWIDSRYEKARHEHEQDPKKGADSLRRWSQAKEAIKTVRLRIKRYLPLVDRRTVFPVVTVPSRAVYNVEISKLRERLRGRLMAKAHELGITEDDIHVDMEKNIRPIGLKTEDIVRFVQEQRIYDKQTNQRRSFTEYDPQYKTLIRLVTPVRVFAPYDKVDKMDKKLLLQADEIAKEAVRWIEGELAERARKISDVNQ